jgi:hypothetical protein
VTADRRCSVRPEGERETEAAEDVNATAGAGNPRPGIMEGSMKKQKKPKRRSAAPRRPQTPGMGDTIITAAGALEARLALVNKLLPAIQATWARSSESGIDDPAVVVADPADLVGSRFSANLPTGQRPTKSEPFVCLVSRADLADILRETNEQGEKIDATMARASRDGPFLACFAHMGSTAGEMVIVDGRLHWGAPGGAFPAPDPASLN